jgi:hypothetical protein
MTSAWFGLLRGPISRRAAGGALLRQELRAEQMVLMPVHRQEGWVLRQHRVQVFGPHHHHDTTAPPPQSYQTRRQRRGDSVEHPPREAEPLA